MLLLNLYTAFLVGFVAIMIKDINSIRDIMKCFVMVVWGGTASIVYYDYFYKKAHYKCPHCGSRKTVKTDDSDGEYFDMDFHCKHCNKDFTIDKSSIGGWPD